MKGHEAKVKILVLAALYVQYLFVLYSQTWPAME